MPISKQKRILYAQKTWKMGLTRKLGGDIIVTTKLVNLESFNLTNWIVKVIINS